jgi:AcrR family transcriptional regulator
MVARDGERTKESILVAAEDLFARQGFERTSMQEIGEAAGVARSTPAYFFRSKDALYEAVLVRAIARAERELASVNERVDDRSPEGPIASYVNALVDLLSRDQNLVRLIQRESLRDGSRVAEFLGRLAADAVAVFTPAAEQAGLSPQRLVLDTFALAWYPLAHAHTLPSALGIKPRERPFLDEQKQHLADLVRARVEACSTSPNSGAFELGGKEQGSDEADGPDRGEGDHRNRVGAVPRGNEGDEDRSRDSGAERGAEVGDAP